MNTLKKAVGYDRNEKEKPEKQSRRRWTPEEKRIIVEAFNKKELKSPPGEPKYVIDPVSNSPILVVQVKSWAKVLTRQTGREMPLQGNDFLNQLADLVTEKVIQRMKQNL